ncbi:MAG: DNA glycosylase AlkZ-like family protein [Candidatus Limnocylindrales bacterium]
MHARRTGLLPEVHRPRVFSSRNPFSVGTVLVDGRAVATWSQRDSRIVVELLEDVSSADRRSIKAEREALEAFCA